MDVVLAGGFGPRETCVVDCEVDNSRVAGTRKLTENGGELPATRKVSIEGVPEISEHVMPASAAIQSRRETHRVNPDATFQNGVSGSKQLRSYFDVDGRSWRNRAGSCATSLGYREVVCARMVVKA